jgi:hypothetical protein
MAGRNRIIVVALSFAATVFAATALTSRPVDAADLDVAARAPTDGIACDRPEVDGFSSVWRGHFSGGYSHHLGPGLPVVLDWRYETLCFPSKRACDVYIREMRRDFHRPEGYFTCLLIR